MMDFELECLSWKERQLALQKKYVDTPPGLAPEQVKNEEERQRLARNEYEKRRSWRLITNVQIPEEPFVGRREELEDVRRLFINGNRTVFLCGMGGIGKSALARAYGRIYAGEYDHILLLSNNKSLEQVLADDGQLGISNLRYTQSKYNSRRQYAREKYQKLAQIAAFERLLVILDNFNRIEDPWLDDLQKIPCDLLITTRLSRHVLSGYSVIPVESLTAQSDWEDFYRVYTGKEPEKLIWKEIETYRESVLGHTLKMKLALSDPEQRWTSDKLSRSILANFRLKKGEKQILCELSFLTLHGIPEEVYLSCTRESRESLETLKKYSLVQTWSDISGRTILSLHPVITEAIRTAWHPNLSRCLAFIEQFGLHARFSWYRQREEDLWLAPQVFAVLERLSEPVAWRFPLYEYLAVFLMEWEYFNEAEGLFRKLYQCVRKYYGETHQFTGRLAFRLASLFHNQMRYEESYEWYELAYQIYKSAKPVDHSFYVHQSEACEKLAQAYEHQERFEEAHRLVDEAFAAVEKFKLDTENSYPELWLRDRARWPFTYLRRATLYFKQGNLDAAQRALDIGTNMFPMSEYMQMEARRQLQVAIYFARGEYEKAKDAAVKDLEICIRYQGESVIVSLNYREMLGDALFALGEVYAAEAEYIQVLSHLQERYPHQTVRMDRLRQKLGKIS